LRGCWGTTASQLQGLDDAEDFETVMNGIRGDQAPVEGRYAELAEVVGPEDAQATPESVLTLLQPVMMMALVDQGIGGLAQDEMSVPVEGPMAEGIMSTVNMGAPEGPAPVNFSRGGAVQYMAAGGPPLPVASHVAIPQIGGRQGEIFREQQVVIPVFVEPCVRSRRLRRNKKT
jgi:hypothetical protein